MNEGLCAIVGGGSGLGKSLARVFAREGFDIACISRSEAGSRDALAAARSANPAADVRFFAADATRPATVEQAFAELRESMGAVEILIYNARGEMNAKAPLEMSYDELREIYELEVVGAYAAAKSVMPAMIASGHGSVVFSSATAALRGSATNPLYAIGKFGLRALSQSLAKAHAKDGVHVVHVRLDCALDVPAVRDYYGDAFDPEHASKPDDVAQSYLWVHRQPRSAWSNEVELRPYTEQWTY